MVFVLACESWPRPCLCSRSHAFPLGGLGRRVGSLSIQAPYMRPGHSSPAKGVHSSQGGETLSDWKSLKKSGSPHSGHCWQFFILSHIQAFDPKSPSWWVCPGSVLLIFGFGRSHSWQNRGTIRGAGDQIWLSLHARQLPYLLSQCSGPALSILKEAL